MEQELALIRAVQRGDQEAFAKILATYEKQVYNLCLRMTANHEDAADLTQEAFIKVWRGVGNYKFESSFSTWIYRLTSNVCIDFLRSKKRRPTISLTQEEEQDGAAELEVPDAAPLPEEQLLQREHQREIAAAMAQLDEEFRMILTLRVLDDLSYEQIAEVMDLKVGTVKSRLARARTKLKNILTKDGNNSLDKTSKLSEYRGRGERQGDMR